VSKGGTDLVFDDGIPEGFDEFAHNTQVFFIFLVAMNARPLGQRQQLVLDPFQGPGMESV
jgi:hypothetical protein